MNVSTELANLFKIACRCDSTLLITGETGTGKSSLARKIHENSRRRARPFIAVNLATLSEGTLESELFGHERGAFTGAELRRVGRFELAQGGTVFLDEVGELRPGLQARLLEFLQSKTISPVGSNREARLDVRIIAATHMDLEASVARREFREDLFHRLRVLSFPMKPLRERLEDLPLLIERILKDFSLPEGKCAWIVSEEASELFARAHWPGNIRELRNVLEYATLVAEGSTLESQHLPLWFHRELENPSSRAAEVRVPAHSHCESSKPGVSPSIEPPENRTFLQFQMGQTYTETSEMFDRGYLQWALSKNGGRINRTARQIGLNKSTLLRRIQKYGLIADRRTSL